MQLRHWTSFKYEQDLALGGSYESRIFALEYTRTKENTHIRQSFQRWPIQVNILTLRLSQDTKTFLHFPSKQGRQFVHIKYELSATDPKVCSDKAEDGKSYVNPPAKEKSKAYSEFTSPITNGIRGGFDVHIYFYQTDAYQVKFANELWQRIRQECRTSHLIVFHSSPKSGFADDFV